MSVSAWRYQVTGVGNHEFRNGQKVFVLPGPSDGTEHDVIIHGDLAGWPVVTINVRMIQGMDQGLDYCKLFHGQTEIQNVWVPTVVVYDRGFAFVRADEQGNFVVWSRDAAGNERQLGMIPRNADAYWIDRLETGDGVVICVYESKNIGEVSL